MNNKILYITLLIVLLTLPIPYITTEFLTGRVTQDSLQAKIAVSSTNEEEDKTIYFDASASSGNINKYTWDFDKNNGIQEDKTGKTTSYAYKAPGIFIATLTITNDLGNQDTDTITLNIMSVTTKIKFAEGPTARALSSNSVMIEWKTDVKTNTSLYYGSDYPGEIITSEAFSTDHQITVQGLQPNKNYLYYIKAIDQFENIKTTSLETFTTPPTVTVTTTPITTSTTTTTTTIQPTCSDGIQNQGEQEIDCGGPCKRCKSDFPLTTILLSTITIILVAALLFFRNYFSKKQTAKKELEIVKPEKKLEEAELTKEEVKIPIRKPGITEEPKKITKPKLEKVPEELSSYIKSCLDQGFKQDQIKEALLEAGWSQEQIDAAFKQILS